MAISEQLNTCFAYVCNCGWIGYAKTGKNKETKSKHNFRHLFAIQKPQCRLPSGVKNPNIWCTGTTLEVGDSSLTTELTWNLTQFFYSSWNLRSLRGLSGKSLDLDKIVNFPELKGKSRCLTILGYFLRTHEIEGNFNEDSENQVHLDVRFIVTILESY
jgi:hypothetical protein